MNLPAKTTARYQLLQLLFRRGPIPRRDAATLMSAVGETKVYNAFKFVVSAGLVVPKDDHTYGLTDEAFAALEEAEGPNVAYEPEIVAPRDINVLNRPAWKCNLSRIPSRADAESLRDIAFKTGSAGFFQGYRDQ